MLRTIGYSTGQESQFPLDHHAHPTDFQKQILSPLHYFVHQSTFCDKQGVFGNFFRLQNHVPRRDGSGYEEDLKFWVFPLVYGFKLFGLSTTGPRMDNSEKM